MKNARIIGGKNALEPIPWQVNLMYRHKPRCGGTLLDRTTILTAAHCFVQNNAIDIDPDNYTITTGTVEGFPPKGRDIPKQIILYPGYNTNERFKDDIAIIKLKRKVAFSRTVKPACLPDNSYNENECFVSGWGYTIPLLSKVFRKIFICTLQNHLFHQSKYYQEKMETL